MHESVLRVAGSFALGLGMLVGPEAQAACPAAPDANLGCEFYAVTLPNALIDQEAFPFGVSLHNPGAATANVTITGGALGAAQVFTVAPGTSTTKVLPWVPAISTSTATVKVAGGAYRIVSSEPLVAVQLNPAAVSVNAVPVGGGDSSTLLPVPQAGRDYRVVTWPTAAAFGRPGNDAVVAIGAGTSVQIAAPGTIQSGAGLNANGGTVSLDAGDVLLLASALGSSADLSGATIAASAPVLAWAGHPFTQVPEGVAFADHLEEMLPPITALTSEYVITRPGNPSGSASGARQVVKLVGLADGTGLSYSTNVGGPVTINAGQLVTLTGLVDFRVTATAPLLIGQFMEGATTTGFDNKGDPGMIVAAPTNQARSRVDFLAPQVLAPISAQFVAPTGTAVTLDGTPVAGWSAIAGTTYSFANVALTGNDAHQALGDRAFSMSVYAYPTLAGYWHPGAAGTTNALFADGFE